MKYKSYKRSWTPETRAKFAETMKRRALAKAQGGLNDTPPQEETLKTAPKQADQPIKQQDPITLHMPGKWLKRTLGDGITVYASFDQRLHFYTHSLVKSNVKSILQIEGQDAAIEVTDCLISKLEAVRVAFPNKSIIPKTWDNEINFQALALEEIRNKQRQEEIASV